MSHNIRFNGLEDASYSFLVKIPDININYPINMSSIVSLNYTDKRIVMKTRLNVIHFS